MEVDTEIKVKCGRCEFQGPYATTALRVTKLITPALITYYEFFCRSCYQLAIVPCHVSIAVMLEEAGVNARSLVVPAEVLERRGDVPLTEDYLAALHSDLEAT